MNGVQVAAPAKVNLWLRVLAKETSGYHSLETLFCAVDLADEVAVKRVAEGVHLEVLGGVDTGPPERNLVIRAARSFLRSVEGSGGGEGVSITLRKRIPSAAGLGGGSSDAAATLRALNRLFGEPLEQDDLLQLAVELGSDIPFFLSGSPLALGWSRGERLLALPALPSAPMLIAHPGEAMSTGRAFEGIARLRGGGFRPVSARFDLADFSRWEAIAELAKNDFEPLATAELPRIGVALERLRSGGALVALLAGSGSSVFGIFPAGTVLDTSERVLRELGFECWATKTLARFPEVGSAGPGTA